MFMFEWTINLIKHILQQPLLLCRITPHPTISRCYFKSRNRPANHTNFKSAGTLCTPSWRNNTKMLNYSWRCPKTYEILRRAVALMSLEGGSPRAPQSATQSEKPEPWQAMSSSGVRDRATEIERRAYCGCAGYCLYAGVWPAGLTVRLRRGIHVQRVLCHGGLARVVWSWVGVGRRVFGRNAILRGCELCRWVRLGHGFWGCWGVLITLKKREKERQVSACVCLKADILKMLFWRND